MYDFNERLALLKNLGAVGIRVLRVSDKRPGPGEKTAGGTELAVQNNQGFIGAFDSRQKVTFALAVEVEWRNDFHVVWTEGAARTIKTLGDQTPDGDAATFVKRIPTSPTLYEEYTTKNDNHNNNGVWFISVTGGKLCMWEIAIVTDIRDGYSRYYLSLQEVYRADLFNKGGVIWVPPKQFSGYEKWESLQSFLCGVVEADSLGPASKYRARKAGALAPLVGNQARVLWFSQSRRYGFAELADGMSVRLHVSEVQEQEFPAFKPGEIVSFEKLKATPQGYDLLGVRAII